MSRDRRLSEAKGLTVRENLIITPIEKHIYYNKFPWRLLLNIALVVLVTAQVWFIFDYEAAYSREEQDSFRYLFMGTLDDHTPVINFNSPSDFQTHLLGVQQTFQNLNQIMFQNVDLNGMDLTILGYDKELGHSENFPVTLSQGFVTNAFNVNDITSIKLFLENIAQMTISASNLTVTNPPGSKVQLCQTWTILLQYDLHQFSQILMTMDAYSASCGPKAPIESTIIGLSFVIFIAGLILFAMALRKVNKVGQVFIQLKASYINFINGGQAKDREDLDQKAEELENTAENNHAQDTFKEYLQYSSWEDVPLSAKMKFFSPWFFFNMVGNIFQMLSSLIMITTFFAPKYADNFFFAEVPLGFSAFFSWTQMLQYLKYWKDVTLITTTLYSSGSNVRVYFGIAIPLFFGFSILAYSLFWKYTAFRTFGMSMRSLFAMAGGDIVHQTYLDTWDEGVISSLFFCLYMIIFFTAFMNIFVAVIMDGYDKGKIRQQLDDDDPFPSTDSLQKKSQKKEAEVEWTEEEREDILKDSTYDLKGKLERQISNPSVDASTKNLINLLAFYNMQAKMNVAKLFKIRNEVNAMENKTSQAFLQRLLDGSFNKLAELIFYHRLALKNKTSSPRKGPSSPKKGLKIN